MTLEYRIPITEDRRLEPEWKDQVERWYQLDENGYIFCEALYHWKKQDRLSQFDAVVLLIPEGSNLSDVEFVTTKPASPAKFVYTLPNIAGSLVAQLTGFQGPIFCFCENTANPNVNLFAEKLSSQGYKKVFLLESSLQLNDRQERVVRGMFFEG